MGGSRNGVAWWWGEETRLLGTGTYGHDECDDGQGLGTCIEPVNEKPARHGIVRSQVRVRDGGGCIYTCPGVRRGCAATYSSFRLRAVSVS